MILSLNHDVLLGTEETDLVMLILREHFYAFCII